MRIIIVGFLLGLICATPASAEFELWFDVNHYSQLAEKTDDIETNYVGLEATVWAKKYPRIRLDFGLGKRQFGCQFHAQAPQCDNWTNAANIGIRVQLIGRRK